MSEEWEQVLNEYPQLLWGIVADVVKAVKADQGEKRTGRRPAASVGSVGCPPAAFSSSSAPFVMARIVAGQLVSALSKR